jgi:hypothetical protein
MSSDRKIAANRRNGCKSGGPRSAAGKTIASRNALKHGLAAMMHGRSLDAGELERIAKALCGTDDDPVLLEAARAVAANGLVLRAIGMQKIATVERLRETTLIALAKGDNSLTLAKARLLRAWLDHRGIVERIPGLLEKYRDRSPAPAFHDCDGMVPISIKALLEECESPEELQVALKASRREIIERDEVEVLREAVPDLLRLHRYERRAWSRQKRAIRGFMNIKIRLGMADAKPSEGSPALA